MARPKATKESTPISFVIDGKRKQMRLGKICKTDRDTIQMYVKRIVQARELGVPYDRATSVWLTGISPKLTSRLIEKGVLPKKAGVSQHLGEFLETYMNSRNNIKKSSLTAYSHTKKNLIEYFGEEKILRSITHADAIAFRRWLESHEKLAKATVARRTGISRMFLKYAIDAGLLTENPFEGPIFTSPR